MKIRILTGIAFGLAAAFFVSTAVRAASDEKKPLETVRSVDLKRYAGKWFEAARLPNRFQKKCVGNVSAEYVLQPGGKIEVTNRCDEKDNKTSVAVDEAQVKDEQTKAKLEVRFAPKFLSFLPMVWGDYWIIELDEKDYQYALVGAPNREYLRFLRRAPQMDEAVYERLLKVAADKGFDTSKVVRTKND